ncbi:hypothetical protein ABNF65_19495, partial [Paenibacillus larvae]
IPLFPRRVAGFQTWSLKPSNRVGDWNRSSTLRVLHSVPTAFAVTAFVCSFPFTLMHSGRFSSSSH